MAKVMLFASLAESLVRFRGPLLAEMTALGHEVVACAPDGSESLRRELELLGVRFVETPLDRTGLNPLRDLSSLLWLRSIIRGERPDVVLSYTIKPNVYASLAASLAGVATIGAMVTGRGSALAAATPVQCCLARCTRLLYRLGLRVNRVVFFQNPDDLCFFLSHGIVTAENTPTLINGSGIDLEQYRPAPFPQQLTFLLVARLLRAKGIGEYAAAAAALKARHPQLRFLLVGPHDDSRRGVPAAEVGEWQRRGWVEHLGRLEDVRPALAAASVYVLPSSYGEGVPRSILEALAMGRPVVTTDAPGCRETVRPGENGFLVPVHDVVRLTAALESFVDNPNSVPRMGAGSRRLAEEKFDVRAVNRTILQSLGLLHETFA